MATEWSRVEMAHKKDTKNKHVYEATTEDSDVPTLYVEKSTFPNGEMPSKIIVTISTED